jgi:hypothetical protein
MTSIPEQIDAIIERHDDHWRGPEALKEAIAVWGAEGQVNDHGVFAGYAREVVAKAGRAVAEVGIYKVRDGVYVHCSHFMSPTEGFGYAPNVWDSESHETETQARQAAIAELLERIRDDVPAREKTAHEDVRQIRQQLQRLIAQPTLF